MKTACLFRYSRVTFLIIQNVLEEEVENNIIATQLAYHVIAKRKAMNKLSRLVAWEYYSALSLVLCKELHLTVNQDDAS